jgi:hypothetical protein
MKKDIYEIMLEKLKDSNLIEYFDVASVSTQVDMQTLIKLAKHPVEIIIKDGNLCYTDDDGGASICPGFDTNVSEAGYWLSDRIPPLDFDVLQGGNFRKAKEAESCYICCVIASVLRDEAFSFELNNIIKVYDFEKMAGVNDEESFYNLLTDWSNLQSIIINVLISAAKYSISNRKKGYEQFLMNGLEEQEQVALRDISLKVKSINFKYSTGVLSPENIKRSTRIETLTFIDERNKVLNDLINGDRYGKLFRIKTLSSEYLSPIKKKQIANWVTAEVDNLYSSNPSLSKEYGDPSSVASKIRMRAYRLATNDMIKENVEKYLSNRESYELPRKM